MTAKAFNVRQSYRKWMFTINNPIVKNLPEDFMEKCEFLTYQLERGESGTPHFQGYLVLKPNPKNKNGRTVKWMCDNFINCFWKPVLGPTGHQDAIKYCNKEETRVDGPWTHGEWTERHELTPEEKGRGGDKNANKILAVKRMIDEGASDHEIWEAHFGEQLRYGKAFDRYRMTLTKTFRQTHTKAVWFYGPPHTGKSHRARAFALKIDPEPYYLQLTGTSQWFDGMRPGCRCVVIEDFRGQAPISFMLNLLDHTPLNVNTKGSMMPFAAEWVVFTSNTHPRDVYGQQPENKIPLDVLNAWHSRFEGSRGCIKHMDVVYKEPVQQPAIDEFDKIETEVTPFDLTCSEELDGEEAEDDEDNDEPDEVEAEGYEAAWDDEDLLENRRASGATAWADDEHSTAPPIAYDERTPSPRFQNQGGPHRRAGQAFCDALDNYFGQTPGSKTITRSDGSTLGLEKVIDKRWGREPVQSKLKFSARRQVIPVNDDGDDDDAN